MMSLYIFSILVLCTNSIVADDVDAVHAAILRELVPQSPSKALDDDVSNFAATMQTNNTWPDIDYDDDSRSWWFAAEHMRRTLLIASAYSSPYSSHSNNTYIRDVADGAFRWWITNDPQNQWWWMQIGIPRIVAKYLLLLPDPELLKMARPLLSRTPLYECSSDSDPHCDGSWTGCNRVWGASFHVLLGAIEHNATRMGYAFHMAHSAIIVVSPTAEGGIQHDGSFHQHGSQLYTGWGYGGIFSTNVLVLESYAKATQWSMSDTTWATYSRFVLDGQAISSRGANFDFLACGRLFTYYRSDDAFGVNQGHYHYFAAFTPFELAFPTFTPPFTTPIGVFFAPLLTNIDPTRTRADEFVEFSNRLNGSVTDTRRHMHFYNSDYTVHHRPFIAVFVRMVSTRTLSAECINTENRRGRMLTDGTMTVYADGADYESVFPLLNWTLLPGTTEVQTLSQDSEDPLHECDTIREGTMHHSFVGGLTEDEYGMAVMDYSRNLVPSPNDPTFDVASVRIGCPNASNPQSGMHCDISQSIGIGQKLIKSSQECEAACCASERCSCWTWTPYERHSADPCQFGQPCCWLKESIAPLQPAPGCTAGHVNRSSTPPSPSPGSPACVSAAKAWFFGDWSVALGARINRENSCEQLPLTTSIQQSNLQNVPVYVGGPKASPFELKANTSLSCRLDTGTCSWVWHGGIIYIVLDIANGPFQLTISNQQRFGSEAEITQGTNDTITGEVFTVFLSHGSGVNLTYGYVVAPCPTIEEAMAIAESVPQRIHLLQNTEYVQAVCTVEENVTLLQAAIWPNPNSIIVPSLNSPCWNISVGSSVATEYGFLLQLKKNQSDVHISASIPAADIVPQSLSELSFWMQGIKLVGSGCAYSASPIGTNVTVSLNTTGITTTIYCSQTA